MNRPYCDMNIKLKPYKKSLDYSYAIGVFPTLELLSQQADRVSKVLLSSKAETNAGAAKIREICGEKNIPLEVADALISRLGGDENSYAIGVFTKYDSRLSPQDDHLVLVNPSDAGNLGAIVRTMLGFDVTNLAVIKPAVDLFAPKTIRASMGSLFQIRFAYFDDFHDYRNRFAHNLYPFMTDGQFTLGDVEIRAPFALVFGNEAAGLGPEFHQLGTSVRIPQSERIDSFNLAIAVGIALYAATLPRFL